MAINVAYGSQSGIQNAIVTSVLPENTILISRINQMTAELSYLDNNMEIRSIVPQTVFESQNSALTYALENNVAGCLISILTNGQYKPFIAQNDYSFTPIVAENDIASRLEALESAHHSHKNKTVLDSITQERIERWDTNADSVISVIRLNGSPLSIEEGVVDIPLATALRCGVVKSSDAENCVSVSEDGVMTLNSLNVNKLVQNPNDVLLFVCGSASNI